MQVIENVKLKGVMKVKIQFYGFEERSISSSLLSERLVRLGLRISWTS